MSSRNLFLIVLFSELSNSNESEESGQEIFDDLPADPESELELEKANRGRLLSN